MLEGPEMDIVVNKGSARAFVQLCVDLAKTDPARYEAKFCDSVERADFKTKFATPEDAFSWYEKKIPALVDHVKTLATLVTSGEMFVIEKLRPIRQEVGGGALLLGGGDFGRIEFYKENSGGTKEVLKSIPNNELIEAFYQTLSHVLHRPVEGGLCLIPIRVCPECHEPFLSRLSNQVFCSQQHNQRWKSREYYRRRRRAE